MSKKIITYLLLLSFLNYIGCSSTVFVTVDEYNQKVLEENPPSEIFITTNDNTKYHFSNDEYYYFRNDTLFAKGKIPVYRLENGEKIETGRMATIEGILPSEDIYSMEESGKDSITVITKEGKRYYFVNKGYFYIQNDTMYGKGVILASEGDKLFWGKIAFFDIKSIYSGIMFSGENAEKEFNLIKGDENIGVGIIVLLKNGTEIDGELLSLRESSIILCTEYSASENELAKRNYPIISIGGREISKITVEGEFDLVVGATYGALIGAAIGVGVGYASGDHPGDVISTTAGQQAVCLGFVFSLIGAMIGGIASGSTTDVIIQLPPDYDFTFLNQLARYPDEEPEFLNKIK